MPTIGHGLLIALGILEPAANLETVLVLYFRRRWRALLTPNERGEGEQHQRHGAPPESRARWRGRPEKRACSR
jgi:hypothetical protein